MSFKKNNHFCPMPFLHLHVDSKGSAKACCVSTIKYGNAKEESIDEIWNSQKIKNLRTKFLNNEKDPRCQNCYDKEASGSESLRMETIRKYEDLIPELIKSPTPLYFDIRFSNICNLKCRTCWHGNSSKWFEDAKVLKRNIGDKPLIKAFKDNKDVRERLGPYFKNAEEFYFAGGEPLMMEEQVICLDQLIVQGNKTCLIRYNSNLTTLHQFDHNLIEKLKFFDRVEFLASIDGLGEKGKMIRSGLDLERFEKNLITLKEMTNISIQLAPTFSLLSADLLPELHKYFFDRNLINIDDIHFNILQQPYFYNVKSLPKDQKEKINLIYHKHIDWIESNNGSAKDWKNAVEFMLAEDWSEKYGKTLLETDLLNKLRSESYQLEIDN